MDRLFDLPGSISIFPHVLFGVPGLAALIWGLLYLTGKKEVNNAMRNLRGRYLFSKEKDWRFDRITRLYGVAFTVCGGCLLLSIPLELLLGLRAAEIAAAAGIAALLIAEVLRMTSKRYYW